MWGINMKGAFGANIHIPTIPHHPLISQSSFFVPRISGSITPL
jgi:hypothetical protein